MPNVTLFLYVTIFLYVTLFPQFYHRANQLKTRVLQKNATRGILSGFKGRFLYGYKFKERVRRLNGL